MTIRSPGRVNLIGDHTDYNEGFVLPIAIDRGVWMALQPRPDRHVRLWTELSGDWAEFDLDALIQRPGWPAYVEGVAHVLQEDGYPCAGFEGVICSDLVAGAGLSSSAAIELAAARAFSWVGGFPWDPVAMAVACQRAENEWVGMNCGVMDQAICATALPDHAMLIDCRTLESRSTPIPSSAAVVVLDTMTRRKLVDSAYNERRAACERAAAAFGVAALRDLDYSTLEDGRDRIDPTVFRRARHVLNENLATVATADALDRGDMDAAGALMSRSHASLRDDYEVTVPALDAMAEAAQASPGCFGARMTGAGFGGSVVALVAADALDEFEREALTRYATSTGTAGSALRVVASRAVSIVG